MQICNLKRVDFQANLTDYHQVMKNWKMVQESFRRKGVQKKIAVDKLIQGRFQDNLEFAQWFYQFFQNAGGVDRSQDYNPVEKRAKAKGGKDFGSPVMSPTRLRSKRKLKSKRRFSKNNSILSPRLSSSKNAISKSNVLSPRRTSKETIKAPAKRIRSVYSQSYSRSPESASCERSIINTPSLQGSIENSQNKLNSLRDRKAKLMKLIQEKEFEKEDNLLALLEIEEKWKPENKIAKQLYTLMFEEPGDWTLPSATNYRDLFWVPNVFSLDDEKKLDIGLDSVYPQAEQESTYQISKNMGLIFSPDVNRNSNETMIQIRNENGNTLLHADILPNTPKHHIRNVSSQIISDLDQLMTNMRTENMDLPVFDKEKHRKFMNSPPLQPDLNTINENITEPSMDINFFEPNEIIDNQNVNKIEIEQTLQIEIEHVGLDKEMDMEIDMDTIDDNTNETNFENTNDIPSPIFTENNIHEESSKIIHHHNIQNDMMEIEKEEEENMDIEIEKNEENNFKDKKNEENNFENKNKLTIDVSLCTNQKEAIIDSSSEEKIKNELKNMEICIDNNNKDELFIGMEDNGIVKKVVQENEKFLSMMEIKNEFNKQNEEDLEDEIITDVQTETINKITIEKINVQTKTDKKEINVNALKNKKIINIITENRIEEESDNDNEEDFSSPLVGKFWEQSQPNKTLLRSPSSSLSQLNVQSPLVKSPTVSFLQKQSSSSPKQTTTQIFSSPVKLSHNSQLLQQSILQTQKKTSLTQFNLLAPRASLSQPKTSLSCIITPPQISIRSSSSEELFDDDDDIPITPPSNTENNLEKKNIIREIEKLQVILEYEGGQNLDKTEKLEIEEELNKFGEIENQENETIKFSKNKLTLNNSNNKIQSPPQSPLGEQSLTRTNSNFNSAPTMAKTFGSNQINFKNQKTTNFVQDEHQTLKFNTEEQVDSENYHISDAFRIAKENKEFLHKYT